MKQHEEFISSERKVNKSVKLSLDLGQSNSTKISQNTDQIESNTFESDELKEKFSKLSEDYKKLEEELEKDSYLKTSQYNNKGNLKTLKGKN